MKKNRIEILLASGLADCYMITSPENQYYYSGFTGGEATLVMTKNERLLFTDSRYTVQAKGEAPDFLVIDIASLKAIDYVMDKKPARIAYEADFVTAACYFVWQEKLPESTWIAADEAILSQRAIKDEDELNKTKQAAELADRAFAAILPMLKPGVREMDVAMALEWEMRKNGAQRASFDIICASGVRSAMPHGVASQKIMEPGDFVTLDFGCFVDGYASDMTRTVVLGKATLRQKEIYQTVLSAQKAGVAAVRSGLLGKEVDAVARDIITEAGLGEYFGHALGHGTGLMIHEAPTLSPRSEKKLEPGMLVTVEPGIYIEGFGGVRIEDLVCVTENGCLNLTTSDKELLEL